MKPITLWVAGIPYKFIDKDLEELFSAFCKVIRCDIIRDRVTKLSKGYAFVVIDENDLENVMSKLNGREVNNRELIIRPKIEKQSNY